MASLWSEEEALQIPAALDQRRAESLVALLLQPLLSTALLLLSFTQFMTEGVGEAVKRKLDPPHSYS